MISQEKKIPLCKKPMNEKILDVIRGYFTLNLQKSSCAKTEHLLRAQSIPNERSIHKEGKMYS